MDDSDQATGSDRPTADDAGQDLDQVLSALEGDPGSSEFADAAADLADRAAADPPAVGQHAEAVVAAVGRVFEAEATTAQQTSETRSERLKTGREALERTLTTIAEVHSARPVLARAAQRWLVDDSVERQRLGLSVGRVVVLQGLPVESLLDLADALEPIVYMEQSDAVFVSLPTDEESQERASGGDDESSRDVEWGQELTLSVLWLENALAEAAVEALQGADSERDACDALQCLGRLVEGGGRPLLAHLGVVLEELADRPTLVEGYPEVVTEIATLALLAYDDPEVSVYKQYDDPDALRRALGLLGTVADSAPDVAAQQAELVARVVENHPDLVADRADAITDVLRAVEDRNDRIRLLRVLGWEVGTERPGALAPHLGPVAALVRTDGDETAVRNAIGVLGQVAKQRPDAVLPPVEGPIETPRERAETPILRNTIGLVAELADCEPGTLIEYETEVADLLAAADTDGLGGDWLATIEDLFGAPPEDDPDDFDRLVDAAEADLTADPVAGDGVSVRLTRCVEALPIETSADPSPDSVDGNGAFAEEDPTPDRSAEDALWTMYDVAEDRPLAVVAHLGAVAETVDATDDGEIAAAGIAVLSRVADDYPDEVGDLVPTVVDWLESANDDAWLNALLALESVADDRPDTVAPHTEPIVSKLSSGIDETRFKKALQVLFLISIECPEAVASHVDTVLDSVDARSQAGHTLSDEYRATSVLGILHNVAEEHPDPVADRLDVVVDALRLYDDNMTTSTAVRLLGVIADHSPEAIVSQVDALAEVLTGTDEPGVARYCLFALARASDQRSEAVLHHVDAVAEALDAYRGLLGPNDTVGDADGTPDDEIDPVARYGLYLLEKAAQHDTDRLRRHLDLVARTLEDATDVRTARSGCLVLSWVAEDDPDAVGPHVDAVTGALDRFEDSLLARTAAKVLDNAVGEGEYGDHGPEMYLSILDYHYPDDVDELLSDGTAVLLAAKASVVAERDPETAAQHVDSIAALVDATDPFGALVAGPGVKALEHVAIERPRAVAPHADTIAGAITRFDPLDAEEDNLVVAGIGALKSIARSEPEAVVDHLDPVVAELDVSRGVDDRAPVWQTALHDGIAIFAEATTVRPEVVAPHTDWLIDALALADDPDVVVEGVEAITRAWTADLSGPDLDAERLGQAIGRLEDPVPAMTTLLDQPAREFAPVVVEVLSVVFRESEDGEPWGGIRGTLEAVLDYQEPPEAAGQGMDLLAQIGSRVPPPDYQ